ncbi:DUF5701 family protein [Paenibacillus sp. UNC499MF]|uniref:DUF5701 family protein n=1 Tax=Paenibacillus sp. UNC499MF TaxID=1502751 RepID=UPI0008A09137|nr:DUF5701 family protein [Paenibacillus sp. UNC499MF]SEG45585.1 hypothetical protein SAMN02799616_03053 [Paenibacillus sp. UNC499MF]
MTFEAEFERQIGNLISKGYHGLAGMEESGFRELLAPLQERAAERMRESRKTEEGSLPFVLVLKPETVPPDQMMQRVERSGKNGFSVMEAEDLARFHPIESVELPAGEAYLILDVDTGSETLNRTPNEAMKSFAEWNRSPLTIEEGIAIITHFPDVLQKNHGFSLCGSRCGDRRVSALWISGGKPKLGWCWAGNPHTWLGSASCRARI